MKSIRPKTIFFDLGGVLVFFSHKKMCTQIADVLGIHTQVIYDHLFKSSLGVQIELGQISSNEMYKKLSLLTKRKAPYFQFLQAASDIFKPNEEILPLLESLKIQGHRLILLSNTCEVHYNFAFSHFPHLKYFDLKILSYEVGLRKPDPRIYKKALLEASCHAEDSFYTDDIKVNTKSAENVGIRSHLFTNTDLLEKELEKANFLPNYNSC